MSLFAIRLDKLPHVSARAVLDTLVDAVRPQGVVVCMSIRGRPATVDMHKLVLTELDVT